MAEKQNYVVNFEIDADGAVKSLNVIDQKTGEAAEGAITLKQELRLLAKELAKGRDALGAEKFDALTARMGALKDEVKETSEAIQTQAGNAFENLGNSTSLLAGSLMTLDFDGASKAMNLLATNAKKINFKELTKGSGDFGKSMLNLAKSLATNPLILLGTAIALIIVNFEKIINIIPNVGAAFEAIGKTISFVVDGIKSLTDAIGLTAFAETDRLDKAIANQDAAVSTIDRQEKRALANAKKNGQDVAQVEADFAAQRIAKYQEIVAASEAAVRKGVKLTEEQVKATEDAKNALFDIETAAIEKEAAAKEKARQEEERKAEQSKQKAEQAAQQAAAKREAARQAEISKQQSVTDALKSAEEERYQSTLSAIDKELRANELKYNKLADDAKNNAELLKQVEEQRLLDEAAIREKFRKEEEIKAKEELDKAVEAARLKALAENETRLEAEEKRFQVERELEYAQLGEIEGARQRDIDGLIAAYEEKFLAAQNDAELEKQLTTQQNLEIAAINQQYKDEADAKNKESRDLRVALEQEVFDSKIRLAQDTLSTLGNIISSFNTKDEKQARRAFEANKAVSIAQALISTYESANAIYKSSALSPITVAFPAYPAVQAALAVAGGLVNVNKIRKTQFKSTQAQGGSAPAPSTGGGGGGGGGGNISANSTSPSLNPFTASQNRPEQLNPKAYVIAGEVQSAVEARSKVEDLARIK